MCHFIFASIKRAPLPPTTADIVFVLRDSLWRVRISSGQTFLSLRALSPHVFMSVLLLSCHFFGIRLRVATSGLGSVAKGISNYWAWQIAMVKTVRFSWLSLFNSIPCSFSAVGTEVVRARTTVEDIWQCTCTPDCMPYAILLDWWSIKKIARLRGIVIEESVPCLFSLCWYNLQSRSSVSCRLTLIRCRHTSKSDWQEPHFNDSTSITHVVAKETCQKSSKKSLRNIILLRENIQILVSYV